MPSNYQRGSYVPTERNRILCPDEIKEDLMSTHHILAFLRHAKFWVRSLSAGSACMSVAGARVQDSAIGARERVSACTCKKQILRFATPTEAKFGSRGLALAPPPLSKA